MNAEKQQKKLDYQRAFFQQSVTAGHVALFGGAVQRRFAGGGQAVGVHAEGEQNADESCMAYGGG
jgi:hypothetical protein